MNYLSYWSEQTYLELALQSEGEGDQNEQVVQYILENFDVVITVRSPFWCHYLSAF